MTITESIEKYHIYINKCNLLGVEPDFDCTVNSKGVRLDRYNGEKTVITVPDFITSINKKGPFDKCVIEKIIWHNPPKDLSLLLSGIHTRTIDISELNLENVEKIEGIFSSSTIYEINLDLTRAPKIKSLNYAFKRAMCLKKATIKSSNNNIVSMAGTFADCCSLDTIDLTELNTENIQVLSGFTADCAYLNKILGCIKSKHKLMSVGSAFRNNSSLRVTSFITSIFDYIDSNTKVTNAFVNCDRLLENADIAQKIISITGAIY